MRLLNYFPYKSFSWRALKCEQLLFRTEQSNAGITNVEQGSKGVKRMRAFIHSCFLIAVAIFLTSSISAQTENRVPPAGSTATASTSLPSGTSAGVQSKDE